MYRTVWDDAWRAVLPIEAVDVGYRLASVLFDLLQLQDAERIATETERLAARAGDQGRVRDRTRLVTYQLAMVMGDWQTALEYVALEAFGVGPWQVRVVPAGMGLLAILAIGIGAATCGTRRTGLVAAALLASNVLWVHWSRAALMEGPMTAFIAISVNRRCRRRVDTFLDSLFATIAVRSSRSRISARRPRRGCFVTTVGSRSHRDRMLFHRVSTRGSS